MNSASARRILTPAFALSGVAGLIYETVLQRELCRTFGASAWATATVLAAFMAGTAIGAWLLGRVVEKSRHPLRFYAVLELGIGACALLTPAANRALTQIFVALGHGQEQHDPKLVLLRIGLAFAFVLVPTLLMGGTLPAMSRALVSLAEQEGSSGRWVSRLYTLNLAGASLGALATGYAFLPLLGLAKSLMIGTALNLAAAVLALWASRAQPDLAREEAAAAGSSIVRPLLLLAALWSGFSSFAFEVVWTHLIALVVGTSVYAFALMLAIFLTGLLFGSMWATRVPASRLNWTFLGWVQLASAMVILATIPLWQRVPAALSWAGPHVVTFWGRELVRAAACLVVVGVPAVLIGAFYPLLLRQVGDGDKRVGRAVGLVTAVNTAGAVIGSLSAGFLLLPALGSRGLVDLLAAAGALVAALCFRGAPKRQLIALVGAAAVLVMPAWNMTRMVSGENVYFAPSFLATGKLLSVAESVEAGFTTVLETPPGSGQLILTSNGKFQGNNTGEVVAQYRVAQLPLLLDHGFGHAVIVGVGTGSSMAMLASQPFESVEVVEMSHDIVDAARRFFRVPNGGILESDRLQLHYGDGRNHLLLTQTRYDLITIELTSIWIAGESDLYNKEFYGNVREHLSPRGVMQQWVQLHHMPRKEMAIVLASVKSQFPHVALFVGGGQGQILASMEPLELNYRYLNELSQRLRRQFASLLVPGGDLLTLYGELVLDETGVEKFIAQEAERDGIPVEGLVSTDDNMFLEYGTPKGNALQVDSMTLFLRQFHRLGPANLPIKELTGAHAAEHVQAARLAGAGDLKGAAQILAAFDEPETKDLKEWLAQQLAKAAPR